MTDIQHAKASFRDQARRQRAEAVRAAGPEASRRLAGHIETLLSARTPGVVSAFLPIADEIDPLPAAARLTATGWTLALPVVIGNARPLVFRPWSEGEPLEAGPLKTRHPLATAMEVVPDVLFVPMLAFDAKGQRIGWGGGFYDRSLAALRSDKDILAVGVAYAGQQVDKVPADAHDAPLDAVVTDQGVIRIEGRL